MIIDCFAFFFSDSVDDRKIYANEIAKLRVDLHLDPILPDYRTNELRAEFSDLERNYNRMVQRLLRQSTDKAEDIKRLVDS
ncbi:MAG: hypothetical protein HKM04_01470 [Legionellales bacterium]|nr:hypothetical protein [Legionellales bacterium]